MPIPTASVGSLPQPITVRQAIGANDRGDTPRNQLTTDRDAAAEDSVTRMEGTGTGIDTDGEQRASSFAPYATKPMKPMKPMKPLKQAMIGPSMLSLLYPLKEAIEGHTREQFLGDLCDESEKDVSRAFAAVPSACRPTSPKGAWQQGHRNPWTNDNPRQTFIDLDNRVLDRFSRGEGTSAFTSAPMVTETRCAARRPT